MITSQIIEQQIKDFLARGGSINVIDGFKDVQLERNLEASVNKKKKMGIGRTLNSVNEKSKAERDARIKVVCEMLEKNSGLSFRDLKRYVTDTYQVSASAANTYIREARRMLND